MLTVPAGPARIEIRVVNSRFIATLDYVETIDEARAFVGRIRKEFPDASHNVPAFVVGGSVAKTEFCSDDGEPSGTAGRPLLAVLRGSGLGNTAIVVTRYFGGTLLGTGGLVKAYSEAGKLVLEKMGKAVLTEYCTFAIELGYAPYAAFRKLVEETKAHVAEEVFGELIRMTVEVPREARARFEARLADLSSGAASARCVGSHMARLIP